MTPDDDRQLRFLLSDFVTFALRRVREELGDAAPPEARVFESSRPLFEQLERHRFVRLADKKQAEAGEELPAGMEEHLTGSEVRKVKSGTAVRRVVPSCDNRGRAPARSGIRPLYRPRGPDPLRRLFRLRFPAFQAAYQQRYAATFGRFRLPLISRAASAFRLCGDWGQGVARIRCPQCGFDRFRPFSCKSYLLCPSCAQKRTLLVGEHLRARTCCCACLTDRRCSGPP